MTNEMQKALASYEAARGRYRIAVLSSLGATGRGEAIRVALRECQQARAHVWHLTRPSEP